MSRLFEAILLQHLQEKKDHIIDKLGMLSNQEKSLVKDYLSKYPNLESKIDWNRAHTLSNPLTYEDFEKVFKEHNESSSKTNVRRKVKLGDLGAMWKSRHDVKVLWQNETDIYVAPLSYDAAKFMCSFDCYGIGAKWCIGYEQSNSRWKDYVFDKERNFVMRYSKQHKTKCMWEVEYIDAGRYEFRIWEEGDNVLLDTRDVTKWDGFNQAAVGPIMPTPGDWTVVDKVMKDLDDAFSYDVRTPFDANKFIKTMKETIHGRLLGEFKKMTKTREQIYKERKTLKDLAYNFAMKWIFDELDIDYTHKTLESIEAFENGLIPDSFSNNYYEMVYDNFGPSAELESKQD